ncbi:hypothetical protein PC129_g11582 [Phytophthora cactorum]|uniref:Uncharacterized protein n=1 Tax=Phytophthora cactorum TaxID=29920 RepID=A0A329RP77_9STRA|nr:hypothetical protein PC113_g10791 [Phytophthora cactorum]KAG2899572.1 hypothetical protein PC114_g13886 [Phytophthora cactorum]KAG2912390.1 hypothetical protein PC115_g12328 [Phytophthora cactorum]KAG2947757.1 hypothetical protein PC117_g6532 [Phytophthora cactorum]KAG3009760.1 hypothetical protein PC119_g13750 [Phytophthora cactorum]
MWVSYMNAIITENPRKTSSLFSSLEPRFSDRPLLEILEAAKKYPTMESAATKMQTKTIDGIFASGKSPTETFKLLRLDNVGDGILSSPLFQTWKNYVEVFNKKRPNHQESWFDPIHINYIPFLVESIIEKAMQNPSTVRIAKQAENDETVLADDAKKPPMRASIGWGNETTLASEGKEGGGTPDPDTTPAASGSSTSETKRGGRRRKGSEAVASGGERRNQKNRYFEEDDETTDIMEIPDLEEEEREQDITTMVAEAPRNTTRAVQSLKQLDKEIKFALPSAQTHGVDLHLLTSALCPERAVSEEDEPWDFDDLLNDIAQEIQKDLDDKEEFVRLGSQESLHP